MGQPLLLIKRKGILLLLHRYASFVAKELSQIAFGTTPFRLIGSRCFQDFAASAAEHQPKQDIT